MVLIVSCGNNENEEKNENCREYEGIKIGTFTTFR